MVIDPKSFVEGTPFSNAPTIPTIWLFAGKDVTVANPSERPVMISREDFEKIQFNTKEELQAALDVLDDPYLNKLFIAAREETDSDKKERAREKIMLNLRTNLLTHAFEHFCEPRLMRLAEPPYKRRIYDLVQLFTDSEGKLVLHRKSTEDGYKKENLQKALRMSEDATVDGLNPQSVHFKAQLRHIIYELVRNPSSWEELMVDQNLDRETIAQRLEELGFPIDDTQRGAIFLIKPREGANLARTLRRAYLPLFIAGLIYSGSPMAYYAYYDIDWPNVPVIGQLFNRAGGSLKDAKDVPQTNPRAQRSHRTNVPNSSPQASLDWDIFIYNSPELSEPGYFTTDTSHEYRNGEWIINQDVEKVLEIPEPPSSKDLPPNTMTTSRVIELPLIGSFELKIPVPNNRELAYLDIWGKDKKDYTVYQLTDGTIKVVINQSLLNPALAAEISAYFIPGDPQVRAAAPLPRLNEFELDEDTRRNIDSLRRTFPAGSDEFFKAMADDTSYNHLYSVTSKNHDAFGKLTKPTELVNLVEHDGLCDCDTCNGSNVWKTTVGQTDEGFLNIAFGYLNNVNAIQRQDRITSSYFLRGEAFHAYGVTRSRLIIDATPSNVNPDEETLKYLELLKRGEEFNTEDSDSFRKRDDTLRSRIVWQNGLSTIFKVAGLLGVGAGVYFGASRTRESLRQKSLAERARETRESLVFNTLSKNDLALAYSFFPWVSYGGGSKMKQVDGSNLTKEDLLRKIQENYTRDALNRYHASPSQLEEAAGIKGFDRVKLRLLSRLLPHIPGTSA